MRIKIRLTILFISIVLIPMLFIGAISYLSARNALEQTTLAGLHAISEFMEGNIFLHLDKLKTRTLDFSSDGYIRDSLVIIADQDAKERVKKLNFHLLKNKKPLNKDILRIDVLNIDGEVVASTDPQEIGADEHKEKYFINGKKDIYVTDVHKGADGRIVLKLSTPLKDRVDPTKIIGVIVNYYDATLLNDLFTGEATLKMGAKTQSLRMGKTDETYLVNQEELMVTRSLFIKDAVLNQKVDTYPVRKGLKDNEEVKGIWPDYRGIPVIGSSMVIDIDDFKWVLLSKQDVAEAFAPINNLRKSLIILGVIVTFLVALVALSISQSISKPILALHKGTEIIEGGNLDYKVGTYEKDEIGQLSRAFDNMVESLKKRNTELKMAIAERKKTEEELRKAKETAEEATQTKSDFLSNMSHEIRTPLNAIVGNIYLLQRTNLALRQKEYVESMNQASDSLLGVINDILDFSKIESGHLDMESADFYLDDVLTKLAGILIITKLEKPLELIFYTSQDVPLSLVGDSLRLGQILTNLANNAIKFTEEGEVTILTELHGKKNGGVTLKFSVKDTGIGMTEDQMAMLFEPFRQIDTSTTREYGGTGLGLTICKKLVEMMNGKIWVESKLGIGSTFFFTADFGQNEEELKKEYSLPIDFKDRSVLVVDDNPTVRELLKGLIESIGFRVTVTGSGKEALDILGDTSADKAFNLVIMDWKMPVMDGIAVTRAIRNLTLETRDSEGQISIIPHPVSTIPIIMTTGYGQEDLSQLTKGLNLKSIIYKPFTRSALFDAIVDVFTRKTAKEVWSKEKPARDLEGIRKISGARILLVEDNKINQKVASELLESVGLSVTIARNGQEAVHAVSREIFDAVLMDIQMPVMGGFEATAQIRKILRASGRDKKIRSVPIIAMTAHAMAGDRKKSLEAGMNDHVTKPIDPNQLFATLVKWIEPGERETPFLKKEIPSTKGDVDLPVSLTGIDIENGLIRVAGNRGLFRKLLIEFSLSNKNAVEEIKSALESKDRNKATRLAHTLKGFAGNLGAHELQAAAADIEAAITAESEELNDIIERMSAALKHVIFGITSLEEGKPEDRATDAGSIEAVDISTVAPLLDELSALLKKNDMQSENLFEKIKDDLHKMQPDKTRQIEKHLSDLNFKDALKELKDIMDSLNMDGSRTNSVEPT